MVVIVMTRRAAVLMALGIGFYFYWFYYMGSLRPGRVFSWLTSAFPDGKVPDWFGIVLPVIGALLLFLSWRESKE